jgi:hypothetical protein
MKTYAISLEVDEEWLKVIQDFTSEVYDGEVCQWTKVKVIG